MTKTADRASGAVFVVLGLTLYFYVFPNHIETVESGWIYPSTIPNAVAVILVVCGAILTLKTTPQVLPPAREVAMAFVFLVLLSLGIWLTSAVGFLLAAPVIALALMLTIGERRKLWLALGCIATPALIWFFVVQLLDRSLP